MSKQKEALGKGIRALLSDIDEEVQSKPKTEAKSPLGKVVGSVNTISLELIEVNPFQPRVSFDEDALHDLSESIKVHGVIQPITVRQVQGGKFQLIAGERRLRASKLAGLEEIPAYIRAANDQESLEIALIENIQREDLNAVEIGVNYQRLIDECSLSHEELAKRVGKKRATISNYLRLLKLPPDIQIAVKAGEISMGHARALVAVDKVDEQLSLFKEVIRKKLSVRQTEELASKISSSKKKSASKPKEVSIEVKRLQKQFEGHLGTKVNIKSGGGGKGNIVISYHSNEDLERLTDMIMGNE